MQHLREAIEERLRDPPPFPEERFSGRGIVICAGGLRYFTCAWVLISILRRVHQTKLPIQVWHLGRNEISEAMQFLLEDEGVEVVNAETILHRYPATIAGGWPLKPYAIAHSRFREVLFLDADTVPLVDPAIVFEWERYRRRGLLLWPDIIDVRRRNPIWETLDLEPRQCMSVDSGVIAIDKARGWALLDIAILFNEHWRESYQYLHGDKDTFLLAALLTGVSLPVIEQRPFAGEGGMIQRDLDGDPFLQHRTSSKWKLYGPNQPVAGAELTAPCEEALTTLRRRWTGAIFHAPERSERARAKESELIGRKRFRYETGTRDGRLLELLRAGAVGEGRTGHEQHWAVIERQDDLVLQFFSGSRLVVELMPQPDGSWRGTSIGEAEFDARLVAEDEWKTWPYANGERVRRSGAAEITAVLDPSLFASGFDVETEQELKAALSLLNRVFDDVPEQLAARLSAMPLPQAWRAALENLTQALINARDARVRLMRQDLVAPADINPQHYTRIF
jgi:hypothetical protein